MQTSLDRPQIKQIHHSVEHAKSNILDFQFTLLPKAIHDKDVHKLPFFINTVV